MSCSNTCNSTRLSTFWLAVSVFIGLLTVWGTGQASHQLQSVRIEQTQPLTLQLQFNDKPSYKFFTLSNPTRLVIDLPQTKLTGKVDKQLTNNNLINRVRYAHHADQRLRMVFDLSSSHRVQSHWDATKAQLHLQLLPRQPSVTKVKLPQTPNLRDVVVVIDPGHGGKDPGAIGPKGTREKDVVLPIAKTLATMINREPGMKAVLTRGHDHYVGLRDRLKKARDAQADIFISIHADAFNNRLSHGASVYALSQRGATSEAARWLAQEENYSELGGVNLEELEDESGVVRSVLIDLSQTATIGSSLYLGGEVLKSLDKMTDLHRNKVEQARFVVLKSPDIPSILVETGFISNPKEEQHLRSRHHREKLARAILSGVQQYFAFNPPRGTYLAARYKASRGA